MHFLLVNDDGIGAVGLMGLLDAVIRAGHKATVCAPATQQSAMSHRFTLWDAINVRDYPVSYPNCKAYAIQGSPVDCTRLGVRHLADSKVDCVISGINDGPNDGIAVVYSGTVSAAMEASLEGYPGVATSMTGPFTDESLALFADYTVRMAERYAKGNPPPHTVLNLNAPRFKGAPLPEAVYAPLDPVPFNDGYMEQITPMGQRVFWLQPEHRDIQPGNTDSGLLQQGFITVSLLGSQTVRPAETIPGLMD